MPASPWDRLPHRNLQGRVARANRTPYRVEAVERAIIDSSVNRVELGQELHARRTYWLSELQAPSKATEVLQFTFGGKTWGLSDATLLLVVVLLIITAAWVLYAIGIRQGSCCSASA